MVTFTFGFGVFESQCLSLGLVVRKPPRSRNATLPTLPSDSLIMVVDGRGALLMERRRRRRRRRRRTTPVGQMVGGAMPGSHGRLDEDLHSRPSPYGRDYMLHAAPPATERHSSPGTF